MCGFPGSLFGHHLKEGCPKRTTCLHISNVGASIYCPNQLTLIQKYRVHTEIDISWLVSIQKSHVLLANPLVQH